MASSSQAGLVEQDEEEEIEHFNDFTLASSWERFISEIEATCRQWLADGPKKLLEKGAVHLDSSDNIYKVKFDLKYAAKVYSMEYYFEISNNGKIADWNSTLHDLHLCFGVKEFLVISPQSASGVVLDAPEATKLLSAVSIALSNCSSLWPAFVPVHDPSRQSYIGIQNMGTIFTRRFEADRIGSQVPIKFMHLEGLYELFVSKFAYCTSDHSMHLFKVHLRMKLTYRTLPNDEDNDNDIQEADAENADSETSLGGDNLNRKRWDDDCPWNEWYFAEDPVKGFDLVATWSEKVVESSLEMAELESASPHEAENWILAPNLSPNLDSSKGDRIGFASQLQLLVNALDISFRVQFIEDFVSVETPGSDNLKSSMVVPPQPVLDHVLKDLFLEGLQFPNFAKDEHKSSQAIKGSPLGSLFTHFCLHSLWFGNCNIRAIAVFWIEFVREIRWHWEESQSLPRIPANGPIDLATCLINQKLQMLAICIQKKRKQNEEVEDCVGSKDDASANMEKMQEHIKSGEESSSFHTKSPAFDGKRDSLFIPEDFNVCKAAVSKFNANSQDAHSADKSCSDSIRRGSSGPVGSMKLLKSCQSLHAPFTQSAPLMTEDMHEERLRAVEAFGDSFNFSAQLERETLSADMSAFKAANPDAVFEDFIRWYSPGDWENDESEADGPPTNLTEGVMDEWPPRGRLSQRMSDHGNFWRKIWDDAPILAAFEQKPLLDPNQEGEKILHYLETLRPNQLLEQMVCTAFRASADILNQTNFGSMKQMNTKMDQLYLTMASRLSSLQVNLSSNISKTIEDLRRLCVVFEHVENLITLAASLHRKFRQEPRIREAIFSDFYNFLLPTMGIGLVDVVNEKEFDMKLQLRQDEREVVSNMFTPPTANQSWRKVLSMGNHLNGHEPILREVIFTMFDNASDSHYASSSPRANEHEVETYRMYTCGTSNDLRVALAVASYD
ncbi:hypothetical protein like AT5G58510 [Hibiscus trionum]|uniref:Rab3 GTPase-activating protein catalytic subunit n=1 Tax=Hibiscus trionum TaxID=183268 RepID=A0A9W7J6C6_HIBTR|nr:hypothetical protein like AT5G58510 [Hibiscus trionum]